MIRGKYGHEMEAVVPSHSRRIVQDSPFSRMAHRQKMMILAVWRALKQKVAARPRERIKLGELMEHISGRTKYTAMHYQGRGVDQWLTSSPLFSFARARNDANILNGSVGLLSSQSAETFVKDRLERVGSTDEETEFYREVDVLSPDWVTEMTRKRKKEYVHYHNLIFSEQCFHFLMSERESFSATHLASFRENSADDYTRIFHDFKNPMREVWRKRIEAFPEFMRERLRIRRESNFSTRTYFIPRLTWDGSVIIYSEDDIPPPTPSPSPPPSPTPSNCSYEYDSQGEDCLSELPKNLQNLAIGDSTTAPESNAQCMPIDSNCTIIMANGGSNNYDLPVIGTPSPNKASQTVQSAEELQRRSRSPARTSAASGDGLRNGVARSRSEHPSAAGFPRGAEAVPRGSVFPPGTVANSAFQEQRDIARNRSMSAAGGVHGERPLPPEQQQREPPRLQPIPQQPGVPFRSATSLLWAGAFNTKKASPLMVVKASNPSRGFSARVAASQPLPATQPTASVSQTTRPAAPPMPPVAQPLPSATPAPRAVTPDANSWRWPPTAVPVPGPWGHSPVSHGVLTPVPVLNGRPSRFAVDPAVASTPGTTSSAVAQGFPDHRAAATAARPEVASATHFRRDPSPVIRAPVAPRGSTTTRADLHVATSVGRTILGAPAVAPVAIRPTPVTGAVAPGIATTRSSAPAVATTVGRSTPGAAAVASNEHRIVVRIEQGGWPTPLPARVTGNPPASRTTAATASDAPAPPRPLMPLPVAPRHQNPPTAVASGNPARAVAPTVASRPVFGRQVPPSQSASRAPVHHGSVFADGPAQQSAPVSRAEPAPARSVAAQYSAPYSQRTSHGTGDGAASIFGVPKTRILEVTVNFLAKAHPRIITNMELQGEYKRELWRQEDNFVPLDMFCRECVLYLQELDIFRIQGQEEGPKSIEIADLDDCYERMSELNVPALAEAQIRVWMAISIYNFLRTAPNGESTRERLDTECPADFFEDLPNLFPRYFVRKRPGVIALAPTAPQRNL